MHTDDKLVSLICWSSRQSLLVKILFMLAVGAIVMPLGILYKPFGNRWDAAVYKSMGMDPANWSDKP